jgi:hypothetical protein
MAKRIAERVALAIGILAGAAALAGAPGRRRGNWPSRLHRLRASMN